MALAERRPVQIEDLDFSFLRSMKGVKTALEKVVRSEFGKLDLKMLSEAGVTVQERIVGEAFGNAGQEYDRLVYRDKIDQLEQVRKAYSEGELTLPDLLEGLGFKAQVESGRGKGFLNRIIYSVGKTLKT